MKQVQEQRQYPRRETFIIVKYTVVEGTFRDVIKNIGAGGLFIRTDRKIAIGQPIRTKFPSFFFDKKLQGFGEVVRRDTDGLAVSFTDAIDALT